MSLTPEVRRGGVPDHSEAEVLIELYGPDSDGWYTSRIHDWVGLCDGLRDPDTRGYLVLRALVYEKFKKPIRNLTLSLLCELIPGPNGKASSQGRVRGILKALSDVGLISTPEGGPVTTSSRAAAAGRPLRIRINDRPNEGYSGWRNVEAKLKWLQAGKPLVGTGQNSDPVSQPGDGETESGRNSDPGGSNSDPESGDDLQERGHPLVPSTGASDALSGRSPGDVRRTSPTGSRGAGVEGGNAASSKASPSDHQHDDTRRPADGKKSSSKKAKHTRAQLALVAAVRALYPEHVLNGWTNPETGQTTGPLPELPVISDAILGALAGDVPGADRTVGQLGARIQQRWDRHGYAARFYAGTMDSLVGSAVAMVRPLAPGDRYYCANGRCDDGVDVETLTPCGTCEVRIEAKKAERRQERAQQAAGDSDAGAAGTLPAMPAQRAVQRVCERCEAPFARNANPAQTVCRRCQGQLGKPLGQPATAPF
ncbi:hypothetical protein [Streptomyces sp. NPDC088348]|uniref:hypothetical protein n=1 Tax=Streptomyces sp. NPDC088348 TaxID=3365853 RepID=UPI0037F60F53